MRLHGLAGLFWIPLQNALEDVAVLDERVVAEAGEFVRLRDPFNQHTADIH